MVRRASWLIAVALTGCVGRPAPIAVAAAPILAAPTPPAPTPINAGLSAAATLWHLRAGLNVAALACRGPDEAVTVARYNALLASHAAAFAAAAAEQQAEYRTGGGNWRDRYDDDQTRLYNFFSQAHGRAALCGAAVETLAGLDGAADAELTAIAPQRLAALDRAFAPPRLEVDARVFGGPVMVAMR